MTTTPAIAPRGTALGELAVTSRPLPDYRDMFLLTDDDLLGGPVLDCPSGASLFAAQLRALGGEAVGVDPAYAVPSAELVARAHDDLDRIVAWQTGQPGRLRLVLPPLPRARRAALARGDRGLRRRLRPRRHPLRRRPAPRALPFPDGRFALT